VAAPGFPKKLQYPTGAMTAHFEGTSNRIIWDTHTAPRSSPLSTDGIERTMETRLRSPQNTWQQPQQQLITSYNARMRASDTARCASRSPRSSRQHLLIDHSGGFTALRTRVVRTNVDRYERAGKRTNYLIPTHHCPHPFHCAKDGLSKTLNIYRWSSGVLSVGIDFGTDIHCLCLYSICEHDLHSAKPAAVFRFDHCFGSGSATGIARSFTPITADSLIDGGTCTSSQDRRPALSNGSFALEQIGWTCFLSIAMAITLRVGTVLLRKVPFQFIATANSEAIGARAGRATKTGEIFRTGDGIHYLRYLVQSFPVHHVTVEDQWLRFPRRHTRGLVSSLTRISTKMLIATASPRSTHLVHRNQHDEKLFAERFHIGPGR